MPFTARQMAPLRQFSIRIEPRTDRVQGLFAWRYLVRRERLNVLGTKQCSSAGSDYFEVDFGSATTVGGVQHNNAVDTGDIPTSGNVQYSDDNSSWTTAASWTSGDIASNKLKKSWTPSSHRYWRLLAQGTANGGSSNWWSIDELTWYSDAAP